MRRSLIALLSFCLAAVASPALAGPGFDAGARGIYWFPKLEGQVQDLTPGVTSPQFDLKNTLGVGDENFAAGEAFLRIGRFHLRVGYTPLKFDGNKQLTDNVVFNGRTFTVNDNVVSHLKANMIDGEIQVDLLQPDLVAASVNLGLIVKVKYVDGEVELRSASQGVQKKDFTAPIPMVGLAAGVGFLKDMIRVDARAAGIAYSGNHLYEGDAFASFAPLPFVRIQGGYRLIDLKIEKTDDILAKLKLHGPYAGVQVAF